MSPSRRALCVAAVVCAGGTAAVAADTCRCGKPAVLIVRVPADAFVELQGIPMPDTGAVRWFESPPLPESGEYAYSVEATWHDAGGSVTVRREVPLRAGQELVVDLRPESLVARKRPVPESARPTRRSETRREVRRPQAQPVPEFDRSPRWFTSRTDWLSTAERQLLDWTNAERRQAGLSPLAGDWKLTQIARGHSAAMARQGQMAHTLNGSTLEGRLAAGGYAYRFAAENLAQGPATPREAVELWMHSPGHRANLLNPEHREMGVGIATGSSGERYYTQVFGAPAAY